MGGSWGTGGASGTDSARGVSGRGVASGRAASGRSAASGRTGTKSCRCRAAVAVYVGVIPGQTPVPDRRSRLGPSEVRSGCGAAAARADPGARVPHHGGLRAAGARDGGEDGVGRPQAAWRRIAGTRIGREPGPPTCEKGWVRQSSP